MKKSAKVTMYVEYDDEVTNHFIIREALQDVFEALPPLVKGLESTLFGIPTVVEPTKPVDAG
jgi:hypothetical protein